MLEELETLQTQALATLEQIGGADALPQWYRTHLGRKGNLTELLRGLGQLAPEERPAVGQKGNAVKKALEEAFSRYRILDTSRFKLAKP